eukprot:COSAG03_NODE_2301_length_2903_cov_1.777104_3_plen_455_part_00
MTVALEAAPIRIVYTHHTLTVTACGAATFASGLPLLKHKWSLVSATGVESQARLFVQMASDQSFIIGYAQSKAHIYSSAHSSLPIVPAYNASFSNTQCRSAATQVDLVWYNTTTGAQHRPNQVAGSAACTAGRFTVQIPAMRTDLAFTAAVDRTNWSLADGNGQRTGVRAVAVPVKADDEGAPVPRQYFAQLVDHNDKSAGTFRQAFYEVQPTTEGLRSAEAVVVFLYLGGTDALSAPVGRYGADWVGMLAEQSSAIVLSLEHRFFGDSMPVPDLTAASLRLLDVEQALQDAEAFISWYLQRIGASQSQVIAFGTGHGAMLAANLRRRLPETFTAAHASGAAVLASPTTSDFDVQCAINAGASCSHLIRQAVSRAMFLLKDTAPGPDGGPSLATQLKLQFGAGNATDDDFTALLATVATSPFAEGSGTQLCAQLQLASEGNIQPMFALSQYLLC